MKIQAHFRVQPRLIGLLGEQYHSTEEAIKELVANAWDADATKVDIDLPEPLTGDPIVLRDNGYGMTRREVEEAYLNIAYNRRTHGEQTPRGRKVRGYRGIGKFAGLIAADTMAVMTESRNGRTHLTLDRGKLEDDQDDIEKAEITLDTETSTGEQGTTVVLSGLRQSFALPTRASLGRALLREFSRLDDFQIRINGVVTAADVLSGNLVAVDLQLLTGHAIPCRVWFTDKSGTVADPGILIRVGERAIGLPTFFGLERDQDVPKSLLKRVYGEISADHLAADVLANWGGFVENSLGYQALVEAGRVWLKQELLKLRDAEVGQSHEVFVESYSEDIERLPAPRREQARRALERVFRKFYDDVPDRRDAIARVVLEALESDEYWVLVKGIDDTQTGDVIRLAELLQDWGLNEIGALAYRARGRLKVLEALELLVADETTLELAGVHKSIESNIWILGDQYELQTSNQTLKRVVERVFGQRYDGKQGRKRPDLILAGVQDRYLLVELKRPNYRIDEEDVAQVLRYRNELRKHMPNGDFDVMVIGGTRSPSFRSEDYKDAQATTFWEMIQRARTRFDWLVENLIPQNVVSTGSQPVYQDTSGKVTDVPLSPSAQV